MRRQRVAAAEWPVQSVHLLKENHLDHLLPSLKEKCQSGAACLHGGLHIRQGFGPTTGSGPEAQWELFSSGTLYMDSLG